MSRGLGVGKETTFGTAVAAQKWYNIIREDITARKTILFDDDTVVSRQILKGTRGAESVEGRIELYLNSQQIGHLLKSLLGGENVSGSGPYTHTFSVADTLPSLTIRSILDDIREKIATGCVIDTLEIVSEIGRPRVIATVLGRQLTLGTPSTPTFPTQDDFLHGEASITLAGTTKKPRRLTLRIANNLDVVNVLGDFYPVKIQPRKLRVTGSFDLNFESDAEYQDFLSLNQRSLNIKFIKGSHSIEFDISTFAYTSANVEVRGRELLVGSFEFEAIKPTTQDAVKVVLVNDDSTAY